MSKSKAVGSWFEILIQMVKIFDDVSILLSDPLRWNITHMKDWLNWAVGELELRDIVNVEKFPDINGRELCNLGREEFVRIVGSYHATDKLMEQLNSLREGTCSITRTRLCNILQLYR